MRIENRHEAVQFYLDYRVFFALPFTDPRRFRREVFRLNNKSHADIMINLNKELNDIFDQIVLNTNHFADVGSDVYRIANLTDELKHDYRHAIVGPQFKASDASPQLGGLMSGDTQPFKKLLLHNLFFKFIQTHASELEEAAIYWYNHFSISMKERNQHYLEDKKEEIIKQFDYLKGLPIQLDEHILQTLDDQLRELEQLDPNDKRYNLRNKLRKISDQVNNLIIDYHSNINKNHFFQTVLPIIKKFNVPESEHDKLCQLVYNDFDASVPHFSDTPPSFFAEHLLPNYGKKIEKKIKCYEKNHRFKLDLRDNKELDDLIESKEEDLIDFIDSKLSERGLITSENTQSDTVIKACVKITGHLEDDLWAHINIKTKLLELIILNEDYQECMMNRIKKIIDEYFDDRTTNPQSKAEETICSYLEKNHALIADIISHSDSKPEAESNNSAISTSQHPIPTSARTSQQGIFSDQLNPINIPDASVDSSLKNENRFIKQ